MVLSSNWLELQNSEEIKSKKPRSVKKKTPMKLSKNVTDATVKKSANVGRKTSNLMKMVYAMSDEIKCAEENKISGKKFEFKPEEVISEDDPTNEGPLIGNKVKSIGKYIGMDCEFVGVGDEGRDSVLARVSLVNYHGHVILDEYVKPKERVTDWRTWVSGVSSQNMVNAITFEEAQDKVSSILKGRILVGHSVKHDLESLLISHPKSMIRDTARHTPFKQTYSKGKTPSLKKLAKEILDIEIQQGQHSSVEDARITMEIYKAEKKEFEKSRHSLYTE